METIPATHFLNESEKPTGKHYVILGMSWAGWLFDFYDLMMFSFLLIPIKETLGLSDASLSLLLGSTLAATALGGILFGYLSDRFGRKTVLSWTILVYSLGTFACGFAQGVWWLLVFRVITGLGVGGEWATGQTLVGETFPAKMRARFAAVMQTGAPLGIALASVVGGFAQPALASAFGPDRGWRGCFFLSVLPALLVVVIRRVMPESDVWLERRRLAAEPEGGHLSDLLRTPGLRRLFLLGLVLALTDMSAYWFTYSWMPKYLYDNLGFSMARSGLWMLVAQAGGLLGYLSFGVFADWKGAGRRTPGSPSSGRSGWWPSPCSGAVSPRGPGWPSRSCSWSASGPGTSRGTGRSSPKSSRPRCETRRWAPLSTWPVAYSSSRR